MNRPWTETRSPASPSQRLSGDWRGHVPIRPGSGVRDEPTGVPHSGITAPYAASSACSTEAKR